MKKVSFYENFAVAYGTFWIATMVIALVTRSHINTGEFGMYGFPILALLYALAKRKKTRLDAEHERLLSENEQLKKELEKYKFKPA